MTPDEISREVRARLTWGHTTSSIRTDLLRAGADPAAIDDMLRLHTRAIDAAYRWKGVWGLLVAALLFLGAYQLSPALPGRGEPVDEVESIEARLKEYRFPRRRGGRVTFTLFLLVGGSLSLAVGVHRIVSGRSGDYPKKQ